MAKPPADFMFDREVETLSRKSLADIQLERLRWSLDQVYENVPHYRKKFDAVGLKPQNLKTLADLKKFPFTMKTDLRDNYPFAMFTMPHTKLRRLHASSGTTGKPTVVGYTKGDLDRWSDLMARSMAAAGARPGDVIHNAYGYGLFTGGLGAHQGAERLGAVVVPVSGGGTERQVMLLKDFGADILCSTPSYALSIAEVAQEMGVDIATLPVRRGIFGAEPWSEEMRAALDQQLGITSVDVYGLSEIMGPGVAGECDIARAGLHGWEDHFLFEVIDPETLESLPIGESGELVVTTLTKEAMPMIRYRTRDITRLTDEPCACGRTHVRILRVTGRDDDMMIIRGVNVYPSQIEAVLVSVDGIAPHYQIIRSRKGAMDAIAVEIELDSKVPPTEANLSAKAEQVRHQIKSIIGITCDVTAKRQGELPRSEGKAVRVIDRHG